MAPAAPLIALVPTRGVVAAELVVALLNNGGGHRIVVRTVNRETVAVARNRLAAQALAAADDPALFPPGSDPYVFWIDSDAFFLHGTLTLMMHAFETNPSIDVLAGLFGPRAANQGATAFRDSSDEKSFLAEDVNFTRGDVVDVALVGLDFILHRATLLRKLGPEPFGVPNDALSEGAAFCGRIRDGGGRIAVATGIPIFHVDERNGAAYSPGLGACVIAGNTIGMASDDG
jgi:GT2 family glycosyltransferase